MPQTEMYVVTKEGVYRHDILGIFNSLELANNHCDASFKNEKDDYHDIQVYKFDLNVGYSKDPYNLVSTSKPPRKMIVIPFNKEKS